MPMPPPPPGPPPPGPPPPPVFNPSSSSSNKSKGGSVDNRGALLQSIRQGTKLKKAVTNDKSAPMIAGKISGSTSSNNDTARFGSSQSSTSNTSSQPLTNGLGLGGLFAGGMPKLRPTGRAIGTSQTSLSVANSSSDNVRRPSPEPTRQNIVSSTTSQLNEVLKKQLSSDIRNRGPPPQPPTSRQNTLTDSSDSPNIHQSRSPFINRNVADSTSPLSANRSTLHQSKSSNTFLHGSATSINSASSVNVPNNNPLQPPKPAISHGKPNVAPKPPAIAPATKPATPPKKLMVNGRVPVSRAQSMRVPRSPPVAPSDNPPFPPTINGKDFGTIRGIPTAFHQSQENLSLRQTQNSRTLPMNFIKNAAPNPPSLNNRPLAPPPSRPPAPPPPSRTGSNMNLKAPLSPPPPPPVQMPPPPPPHRTSPAPPPPPSHTRPTPAIPLNGPPPPPVRNSSMRNGSSNAVSPSLDFDTRFSNLFHPVSDFPSPTVFRGLNKFYNSKNVVNKQQAPLPPNTIHLGTKLSESSTC